MLKVLKGLLFLFTALFAMPAMADTGACQIAPSISVFKVDKPGLERKASFINLWWKSGRPKDMPFEEAKAQRVRDIDEIYSSAEENRRQAYANASCLVVSTKKCASTAGNRHECPMTISPPANMRFIPSTLQAIDDDFDVSPRMAGSNVTYTVKKTGKGSNTAGFQAMAQFTPAYIDKQIENELAQMRAIVDPIVLVDLN